MSYSANIFVSYSHDDESWCDAVAKHLRSLHDPLDVTVWVDRHRIRAGSAWLPEIEGALASADLAILLISPAFLSSDFIRKTELPKLLARREKGLPVIPILVMPCSWKAIGWLQSHELRPRGDHALAEIGSVKSAAVNRQLGDLMDEIAGMLREQAEREAPTDGQAAALAAPNPAQRDKHAELAGALLAVTLLEEVVADQRAAFAAHIVQMLAKFCGLAGEALFNALRLFIEYQLLRSDAPTSAQALQSTLDSLEDSDTARRLAAELKRGAKTGDFASSLIDVNSLFFMLARERESLWERYFDELQAFGCDPLATLCRIRVKLGFVAPQFLVAGLLSHFEDDWRPVLNAYQHSIPSPRYRSGAFESLQASQWNCWLVWGPSIPICRCAQWQGKFAYQYGYGDENNSLPLVELEADTAGRPLTLDPVVTDLAAEGRSAKLMQITGRLRWGPQFLGQQDEADTGEGSWDDSEVLDLVDDLDRDDVEDDRQARKYPMASAQASLWCGEGPGHAHHSDGLVLQLEHVDREVDEARVYFSAYLWMMFLVTVAAPDESDPDVGPQLLRRKHYPPWPEEPAQRIRVRDARLWEELLPVFVHANIADPAALHFQRRTLVANAVQMLRQLWERRAECFDADDVAMGIRFHLVCSSDYSGCDCEVRYPSAEPLPALLQRQLASEEDRDFAAAILVPDSQDNPAGRPWGLAGYYSSCHLPELVADYFSYIDEIQQQKAKR
ncbi:toll/interleukin-1 receptor domain-containing protein [Aromatoleum diolicum]|nr:toll/interleukin-1 receptor domain-containing protein [Aromatoleum diolicum]